MQISDVPEWGGLSGSQTLRCALCSDDTEKNAQWKAFRINGVKKNKIIFVAATWFLQNEAIYLFFFFSLFVWESYVWADDL